MSIYLSRPSPAKKALTRCMSNTLYTHQDRVTTYRARFGQPRPAALRVFGAKDDTFGFALVTTHTGERWLGVQEFRGPFWHLRPATAPDEVAAPPAATALIAAHRFDRYGRTPAEWLPAQLRLREPTPEEITRLGAETRSEDDLALLAELEAASGLSVPPPRYTAIAELVRQAVADVTQAGAVTLLGLLQEFEPEYARHSFDSAFLLFDGADFREQKELPSVRQAYHAAASATFLSESAHDFEAGQTHAFPHDGGAAMLWRQAAELLKTTDATQYAPQIAYALWSAAMPLIMADSERLPEAREQLAQPALDIFRALEDPIGIESTEAFLSLRQCCGDPAEHTHGEGQAH